MTKRSSENSDCLYKSQLIPIYTIQTKTPLIHAMAQVSKIQHKSME
ncbi:hypothetical protein NEISICOT_01086 [Neisseria sicca ATCC 29256]|uniref:Uncharacterized protein n=1 Tax=Neisseria sicca ATCC 29256 TaxID=547045 RepID=C6M3D8_NEISI|nr:hypothetical protein NEISICOT_01086 [Neisseria sicca ATCC 29256]